MMNMIFEKVKKPENNRVNYIFNNKVFLSKDAYKVVIKFFEIDVYCCCVGDEF